MKKLTVWVDEANREKAGRLLPESVEVFSTDAWPATHIILSEYAHYFADEWWDDPKLVEAALKRARTEKKRRK
jgi:hypothetical protein